MIKYLLEYILQIVDLMLSYLLLKATPFNNEVPALKIFLTVNAQCMWAEMPLLSEL